MLELVTSLTCQSLRSLDNLLDIAPLMLHVKDGSVICHQDVQTPWMRFLLRVCGRYSIQTMYLVS